MKKWVLGIGGLVLLSSVVFGAVKVLTAEEELMSVQAAKVNRETIIETVDATGRIQPKTQIRISADVSAKIMALHVEEGDWVEQGKLLVELDSERFKAAVERAEANVRSAQANAKLVLQNMNKSEKDFDRSRDLVARKLESQSVLDTVEAAYKVEVARYEAAMDDVAQAEATLKQARDDLSKTLVYAPMAGTISDLNKEQGEIAIGSQFQEDVILVIADLTEMEAQVNVDENDIVNISIGQEASIEVDALYGQKLKGRVYEIANSANSTGQGTTNQKTEFEVKIAITDEIERLRPGMTASADIFTQTKEGVVGVPIQSVAVRTMDQLTMDGETVDDIEGKYTPDSDGFVEIVFAVENGRAVARQVKTGIQSDDMIEIVSGIDAEEQVVTGSYRAISNDLQNGSQVNVEDEA